MLRLRGLVLLLLFIGANCSSAAKCNDIYTSILDCSGLGFSSIPRDVNEQVKQVDLSRNKFHKLQNDSFEGFLKITNISLSTCEIQEIEIGSFWNLSALLYLDLSGNNIQFFHPATFRKMSKLKQLNLNNNPLKTLKSHSFNGMTNLAHLKLSNCYLNEIEPEAFSNVMNLKKIWLNDNKLTKLPEMTYSISNLTMLRVEGNPLVCDCRLKWFKKKLGQFIEMSTYPINCTGPAHVKNRDLHKIPLQNLTCVPVISHPLSNITQDLAHYGKMTFSCKMEVVDIEVVDRIEWTWTDAAKNISYQSLTGHHYIEDRQNDTNITYGGGWSNLTVNNIAGGDKFTCKVENEGGRDLRIFTLRETSKGGVIESLTGNKLMLGVFVLIISIVTISFMAIIWRREKSRPLPDEVMYQPREDLINTDETVANPVDKPPRLFQKRSSNASEISRIVKCKKGEDDEFDRVSVASVNTAKSPLPHTLHPRYTPDLLTFPQGFSTMYLTPDSPTSQSLYVPQTPTKYSTNFRYPTNGEYAERVRTPTYLPLSRFDSTPTLFNYCSSPTNEVIYGTRRSSGDSVSLCNYRRPLPPVPAPQSRTQQYPHYMYQSLPRGGGVQRPQATRPGTLPRTLSAETLVRHNNHASQHRVPPNTRRYAPPSVLYETDNETYETIV